MESVKRGSTSVLYVFKVKHKKINIDETPIRAHEMIIDLISLPHVLRSLAGKGKVYDSLIEILSSIGEDDKVPTSKELQSKLSLAPLKFKNWLDLLFSDFRHALANEPVLLTIEDTICELHIAGRLNNAVIRCRLPHIPRVGETIELPSLANYTGIRYQPYVASVNYVIEKSTLLIQILINSESYRPYYNWAKDRLLLENKIDINDYYMAEHYEIEHLIREKYGE